MRSPLTYSWFYLCLPGMPKRMGKVMVAMLPTTSPFSLDNRAEIPKQGAEVKHLAVISFSFLSISTLLLCIVHTLHHDPTSPLLSFSKLPSSDKHKPLEAFHAPHFFPPHISSRVDEPKKNPSIPTISPFSPTFLNIPIFSGAAKEIDPKKGRGDTYSLIIHRFTTACPLLKY